VNYGELWGFYTQPQYRGRGLASYLLEAVICYARTSVAELNLSCVTTNLAALKLYYHYGFRIYALQQHLPKPNHSFVDKYFLSLALDPNNDKSTTKLSRTLC